MYLLILHVVIVAAISLRVVLRDEVAPATRLAWVLILLAVPLAGIILYFLFGEAELDRTARNERRALAGPVTARAQALTAPSSSWAEAVAKPYLQAFSYCASINGFPPTDGNTGELMADAASARARLLEDIDAAQTSVNVLYYIWLNDNTGTGVAHALIRAARRGVTCRAMADGLGSRRFIRSPLWREMADAGVSVSVALPIDRPIRTAILSRIDLRNHRKITVIDGSITHCGSQNCADPEFRVKPRFAPWVDIMLRVTGPVVAQNQLLLASDWIVRNGGTLDDFEFAATPQPDGFVAQIMGDGPTERRLATPHLFAALLHSAQQRVTISTPYFVPGPVVLEAICAAAFRGVAVTIIFPRRNDSFVVGAVSRASYAQLLTAGVAIHEFDGGLLHAKTLTIDGQISLIGSSNMDLRSFDLNYENNLLLADQVLTHAIEQRQASYIAQSRAVGMTDVLAWPWYRRALDNAIATVGPVL